MPWRGVEAHERMAWIFHRNQVQGCLGIPRSRPNGTEGAPNRYRRYEAPRNTLKGETTSGGLGAAPVRKDLERARDRKVAAPAGDQSQEP
jgi:hypothetical protein